MPKQPTRFAFSLLELLIVLSIMVAMAAVAWPSLRRPLADSTVQQAANQLRDQIASCRQAAALQGQPRLMRFEAGAPAVHWGSWTDLITEQLSDTTSVGLASVDEGAVKLETWELPVDIVVDEVQLDEQTYIARGDTAFDVSSETDLLEEEASFEFVETAEETDSFDDAATRWYLPFLPNGQTRDAVIVLRDYVTGSRVALELDAVTGMMRTSRLVSVEPEPVSDLATEPPSDLFSDAETSADDLAPIDWGTSE